MSLSQSAEGAQREAGGEETGGPGKVDILVAHRWAEQGGGRRRWGGGLFVPKTGHFPRETQDMAL